MCSHPLESSESSGTARGYGTAFADQDLPRGAILLSWGSGRAARPLYAGTAQLCVPGWAQARPHLAGDGACYPERSCWGKRGSCCSNPRNLFWLCPFRLKGKRKKMRGTKGVGKDSLVSSRRLVFSGAHLCPAPWWAPELRKQWELGGQGLAFGAWQEQKASPP